MTGCLDSPAYRDDPEGRILSPTNDPTAIKNGVTEAEIVETITRLAFYVGWPGAMSALNRAKALFAKKEGS